MPTGSGKTAVLMLAPFLLDAHRVLVVTPSRLVRTQIASEFQTLAQLRAAQVVPEGMARPNVREVHHRLGTPDAWETLKRADVVVGTPGVVSPAMKGVAPPPPGFFDLILVDEAHHSAAQTWKALFDAFSDAKRVLFTATPFRRDNRELRGSFIFTYPLQQAYEDQIFGEITYHPVAEGHPEGSDIAIALEAERVFREDQARGYEHVLMVRANTKKRAEDLAELYARRTTLRLAVVHSDRPYSEARSTLEQLQAGGLDGVVCVDMMSEGFDFPRLKIAALHAPHKSLGVTLQFVGRFARMSGPNLGTARFLAVPSEIQIEAEELYKEGKVWSHIVPGLLDERVEREEWTKAALETFEPRDVSDEELREVSLWALRPSHHVRVYEVADGVDLDVDVQLPRPFQVKLRHVSHELSAAVFVAMEMSRPRWTYDDRFINKAYELFAVYYSAATGYLFICASDKAERLYEEIVRQFAPNGARPLMQSTVTKAMAGIKGLRIFNLGLRRRVLGGGAEAYRTYAGSKAHLIVSRSDGMSYHPGHLSGQGTVNGQPVNMGVSLASKVWSPGSSQIPALVEWCEMIAQRLDGDETVITNSEWDNLKTGEPVEEIPDGVIAARWHEDEFERPVEVTYEAGGAPVSWQLLDLDLAVDVAHSDTEHIRVVLTGPGLVWPVDFWLNANPQYRLVSDDQPAVWVDWHGDAVPLIDHLNHRRLRFHFADGALLVDRECFRMPVEGHWQPFDTEQIEGIDWQDMNVEITVEIESDKTPLPLGQRSVHAYLMERLVAADYDVVFYDHTQGELADFLAVRSGRDHVRFEVYHCKGSGEDEPGNRVQDVYEVCCQVVKGLWCLHHPDLLLKHVRRRQRLPVPCFLKGDYDLFKELVDRSKSVRSVYEAVVVQPGVKRSALEADLGRVMAAAHDYLRAADCEDLRVLGSS